MTSATTARRRMPHPHTPAAQALGNYEAHVGAHVVPEPDGHWVYTGRLSIEEVRRYVAQTFDPELPDAVELTRSCGRARCVRPPHMAVTGGLDHEDVDL